MEKIIVRGCCYICRWFTGKYTCNRRQERFVHNMYIVPDWCPGFEVKEVLRAGETLSNGGVLWKNCKN